jgi:hypothetical protein
MSDDNKIDINLSLDGALAGPAMTDFVAQIGAIQAAMQSMVNTNAQLVAQLNGQVVNPHNGGPGPNASNPPPNGHNTQTNGGPGPNSSTSEMSELEKFARQRLPLPPHVVSSLVSGFKGEAPLASAAAQQYVADNDFGGYLRVFGGAGGDMPMADRLKIAARGMGHAMSNQSGTLGHMLEVTASNPWLAYGTYRGAKGFIAKHSGGPADVGAALGYEREPWALSPFGQIPLVGQFTGAGQEGWGERMKLTGLRLKPGVNKNQAQAMMDALYEQGLTGGDFRDRTLDAMTRLTQRWPGIDQNLTGQMLVEATRYGNANVGDVADDLDRLGKAAKKSTMTFQQLQQTVNDASNELGSTIGGYKADNISAMVDWFETTGMTPRVSATLAGNGFVQSMTMAQTSMPVWAQGLIPGPQRASEQLQSVQRMVDMYKWGGDQFVTDPTTGFRTRVTGTDYGISQAAAQLGLTVDEVRQLYRHAGTDIQKNALESTVDHWQKDVNWRAHTGHPGDAKRIAAGGGVALGDQKATWDEVRKRALGIKDEHGKHLITDKELKDIERKYRAPQSGSRPLPGHGPGRQDAEKDVQQLAEDRRRALEDLVAKKTKERSADEGGTNAHRDTNVTIDLTDDAKKLIKVGKVKGPDKTKQSAQAGGQPYMSGKESVPFLDPSDPFGQLP